MSNGFHWRDDIHFQVTDDGSVRLHQPHGHFAELFVIPPLEWDSIVGFVDRERGHATRDEVRTAIRQLVELTNGGARLEFYAKARDLCARLPSALAAAAKTGAVRSTRAGSRPNAIREILMTEIAKQSEDMNMSGTERCLYDAEVHGLRMQGWSRIEAENEALGRMERRRRASAGVRP